MAMIRYSHDGSTEEVSEFELPEGMATTKVGRYKNMPVQAITDSAGPNVIVGGRNYRTWLVSRMLDSHEAAVELAQKVVNNGPGIYDGWFDYKDEAQAFEAFHYMMGATASRRKR